MVAVVIEQRGQPATDADIRLHPRVLRVLDVHVVALVVGDHLERQLVVIAQEHAPLAVLGDGRVWARISEIGFRCPRRTAMKIRGISGK